MALRQIKRGTVNDHLIEWAIIDDQFPYPLFCHKQQFPPLSWKLPYHILQKEVPLDFLSIRINQIAQSEGSYVRTGAQTLFWSFPFSDRSKRSDPIGSESSGYIAIMPTGNGKSLCYQLPGYLLEGLVVIVSPLLFFFDGRSSV